MSEWSTATVPRSLIGDGLSLMVETPSSICKLAGVGKVPGDSMTMRVIAAREVVQVMSGERR